ncbi:MAG: S1 family peptidase [Candidatus Zhuqueibacterota bacterium]
MKRLISKCSFVLVVAFLLTGACSRRIQQVVYPTLGDGRYDSEFPYKSCSKELEEITASVRKLYCSINYKTYIFDEKDRITMSDLNERTLKKAIEIVYFQKSVAGTGTVIFVDKTRIALLTCAHVVTHPDTLYAYVKDDSLRTKRVLQSCSIKQDQDNFIVGLPEGGELDVLIADEKMDIAILKKEFQSMPKLDIPALRYPFGKAKDLEWGSFVYLIGFPKGYKIITKGIVSHPNRDKHGSFLTDAMFNQGMSGGILLAIRDGVPNFEVVGITTSAAAEFTTMLVPDRGWEYDEAVPYEGKIYVDNKKTISYGITRAISSEAILELIDQNKEWLLKQGFEINLLTGK